ncbi:MAG TPA: DUF4272 domain-containing protein [Gaiellales bacterium]|nr:DUF4272 domain-containing protein [Gaiellales bacterium]
MILRRKRAPVVPDQDAVVDRALCISVTAMLGAIVAGLEEGEMDDEQAAAYVTESHRWLRRETLADSLSSRERALVAKPLADWTEQESIDVEWRSESLGVLLWALSAVEEMPPYDARFEALPSLVPLLAPTADFRRTASLRPAQEIEIARDLAELWHWRARTRQLQERGDPQAAAHDLDAIARQTAALSYARGGIPEPIDGDFPAFGKAYRALDENEYSAVTSASAERHYALNWLSGYASDWDRVPTET